MAQRAMEAPKSGEYGTALMRLVVVMQQVAGHEASLTPNPYADIGRSP